MLMTLNRNRSVFDSIVWHGLLLPGHEACRLFQENSGWQLEGSAVFSHDQLPCRLDYQISCDVEWRTLSAHIKGWRGKDAKDIQIEIDSSRHWHMNGVDQTQVSGCVDLDLNFSPSTNLLPIRRLNLGVGESTDLKTAWLRFPRFTLEPLSQQYLRLDEFTYRYQSAGGKFVADLKVNSSGLVVDYPGIWQCESIIEMPGLDTGKRLHPG